MYVVYTRIQENGTNSWAHLFTKCPDYWHPPVRKRHVSANVWMVPGTVNPED